MKLRAREWLDCARNDIDACYALKAEGLNALAVFHLQQGTEKTLKAELLLTGLYTEKEVAKFSHGTLKACLDFRFRLEKFIDPGIAGKEDSQANESRKRITNLLAESPERIAKISYTTISDLLMVLEEHRIASTPRRNSPYAIFDRQLWSAIWTIQALALLVAPHQSWTRYPDGDLKPWDYSEDSGIVKAIPDMLIELERINGFLYDLTTKRSEYKAW